MDDQSRDSFWVRCAGPTASDRRNQLTFAAICLGWALCFVGCAFLLSRNLLPEGPWRWAAAALPTLAGLGLVAAFVRFLRAADEFQRLVQLQALGVGFAGGFLVLSGYPLFVPLGAPDLSFSDIATMMPILYAAGILLAAWRYR